jgi:hypothetical protein
MVPLKDVTQFRELSSMRVDVVGDNGKFALLAVSPAAAPPSLRNACLTDHAFQYFLRLSLRIKKTI